MENENHREGVVYLGKFISRKKKWVEPIGLTCPDPGAYVSAPPLEEDLAAVVAAHAR